MKSTKVRNIKRVKLLAIVLIIAMSLLSFNCMSFANTNMNNEKEITKIAAKSNSKQAQEETADKNYLKSLSVEKYDMYPEFNKNTTTYYVVIPTSVNEVDVNPETEDSEAKYAVTGNTKIAKGGGIIKVTVTPKSGSKRTYTINVSKQDDNNLKLSKLEIANATLTPEFSPTKHYYSADISMMNISPLDITAEANDSSAKVEIIGNDSTLVEGNNLVSIILTKGDEVTTYEVNVNITKQFTFEQRTGGNEKIAELTDKVKDKADNFFSNEENVLATLVAVAFVLIIIIILVIVKIRRKNKWLRK